MVFCPLEIKSGPVSLKNETETAQKRPKNGHPLSLLFLGKGQKWAKMGKNTNKVRIITTKKINKNQ